MALDQPPSFEPAVAPDVYPSFFNDLAKTSVVSKSELNMLQRFAWERHSADFVEREVLRMIFRRVDAGDISDTLRDTLVWFRRELGI